MGEEAKKAKTTKRLNHKRLQGLYEDHARKKQTLQDAAVRIAREEEDEMSMMRQSCRGEARPETFFRLYMDGMNRESNIAAKRAQQEFEQDISLKAKSVHRRTMPGQTTAVFDRLYQQAKTTEKNDEPNHSRTVKQQTRED